MKHDDIYENSENNFIDTPTKKFNPLTKYCAIGMGGMYIEIEYRGHRIKGRYGTSLIYGTGKKYGT